MFDFCIEVIADMKEVPMNNAMELLCQGCTNRFRQKEDEIQKFNTTCPSITDSALAIPCFTNPFSAELKRAFVALVFVPAVLFFG